MEAIGSLSKDVFLSDVGYPEVDFSWAVVLPTFLSKSSP